MGQSINLGRSLQNSKQDCSVRERSLVKRAVVFVAVVGVAGPGYMGLPGQETDEPEFQIGGHQQAVRAESGIKTHLVVHKFPPKDNTTLGTIATHYDCLVANFFDHKAVGDLREDHNSSMRVLGYKSIVGMHEQYPDWNCNQTKHECHLKGCGPNNERQCCGSEEQTCAWDKSVFIKVDVSVPTFPFGAPKVRELRLKNNNHCWYLMNPAASQWRSHYAASVTNSLKKYTDFDGVFADDTLRFLYHSKWHVVIKNEMIRGEDISRETRWILNAPVNVTKIKTTYPIFVGPGADCIADSNTSIRVLSPSGSTVYPGSVSADGTHIELFGVRLEGNILVFANYSGKVNPPQDSVDSWSSDLSAMISKVQGQLKAQLGDDNPLEYRSTFVVNTPDRDRYIQLADGIMDEEFAHSPNSDLDVFKSHGDWEKDVRALASAEAAGKLYLAHCGMKKVETKDMTDEEKKKLQDKIEAMTDFCFGSFLLGMAQFSSRASLYFGDGETAKPIQKFESNSVALGSPNGKDYVPAQCNTTPTGGDNLIENPSFANTCTPSETPFRSWGLYSQSGLVTVETSRGGSPASDAHSAALRAGVDANNPDQVTATGHIYQYLKGAALSGGYYASRFKEDTAYTLSGWIKTEALDSVTRYAAELAVYFPGATGSLSVGVPPGSTIDAMTPDSSDSLDDGWRFVSTTFRTGKREKRTSIEKCNGKLCCHETKCPYVAARINSAYTSGTGTAWFDDIRISEGAACHVYKRAFKNGVVAVNPTADEHIVDLDSYGFEAIKAYSAMIKCEPDQDACKK